MRAPQQNAHRLSSICCSSLCFCFLFCVSFSIFQFNATTAAVGTACCQKKEKNILLSVNEFMKNYIYLAHALHTSQCMVCAANEKHNVSRIANECIEPMNGAERIRLRCCFSLFPFILLLQTQRKRKGEKNSEKREPN